MQLWHAAGMYIGEKFWCKVALHTAFWWRLTRLTLMKLIQQSSAGWNVFKKNTVSINKYIFYVQDRNWKDRKKLTLIIANIIFLQNKEGRRNGMSIKGFSIPQHHHQESISHQSNVNWKWTRSLSRLLFIYNITFRYPTWRLWRDQLVRLMSSMRM